MELDFYVKLILVLFVISLFFSPIFIQLIIVLLCLWLLWNSNGAQNLLIIKGNFIPTLLDPIYHKITKNDLIKSYYQESNLRKTMQRFGLSNDYPVNDVTAPIIASHLSKYQIN